MASFDPSAITKAGDLDAVPALLKKVNLLADKDGDAGRQDLMNAAKDLFLALETPREAMIRQIWAEVRDAVHYYFLFSNLWKTCPCGYAAGGWNDRCI